MKISVIIPYFNAAKWIRETLASVAEQAIQDMEVIVVDDGSTDEGAKNFEQDFPFVQLVRTGNQGPSLARNLGFSLSKGEFIQFLDADDLLAPGKLKLQLETLESTGAEVAYGAWQKIFIGNDGNRIMGKVEDRKLVDSEADLFTDFWCPPAAYLFRRGIVEKTGGFRESLAIIQDARFALDCALQGARFVYCQGIMAYYRVHSSLSVSQKDPVAFYQDCLRNANEVQLWWLDHGGINQERKKALLRVYNSICRASFENDSATFEAAYKALNLVDPGHIPEKTRMRLVYKIFGYRNAELVSLWYRRSRAFFSLINGRKKA